jgi:hypothetical protein
MLVEFLIGHQEVVPLSPNLPVLQLLLQLDIYLVMMGLPCVRRLPLLLVFIILFEDSTLIISCPPRDMPPTAEPLVSKMVPVSNIVDDPEPPTSTRTGLVQRVEHALTIKKEQ